MFLRTALHGFSPDRDGRNDPPRGLPGNILGGIGLPGIMAILTILRPHSNSLGSDLSKLFIYWRL